MNHDLYRSTDTSAPVIDNTAGSLTTTLDGILVTGFPTQAITSLTHSAGVITGTLTAHGYTTGDVISVSGAAPDEYNGRVTITVSSSSVFTYAPAVSNPASSPATGTILASTHAGKAGLGWQLVATATSKRLYRPRFGSRHMLGVDGSVNVYEARVRGFEGAAGQASAGIVPDTSDAVNKPFPTVAQLANAVTWQKTINTAGNRAWICMGDDRRFFINIQVDAVTPAWNMGYFGDLMFPCKAGDLYHCLLIGKSATTATSQADLSGQATPNIFTAAQLGHYMPRSYTQTGSAVQVAKTLVSSSFVASTPNNSGSGTAGSTVMTYPDPVGGGLQLARFMPYEATLGPRGYLPGYWFLCHNFATMAGVGVADGDTFPGADALNAMTFELRRLQVANTSGAVVFETTAASPWT